MYNVLWPPPSYNLSAILPRASANLRRTATKLSPWSFRCSLSCWKLVFWASSWATSILPFLSKTSIKWYCRLLVSSSPSIAIIFLFLASWEAERITGFQVGCFSLVIAACQLIIRTGYSLPSSNNLFYYRCHYFHSMS